VRENKSIMQTKHSEVNCRNNFVGHPQMHHSISVSLADEKHRGVLERRTPVAVEVVCTTILQNKVVQA
jgi:hypothetical protein